MKLKNLTTKTLFLLVVAQAARPVAGLASDQPAAGQGWQQSQGTHYSAPPRNWYLYNPGSGSNGPAAGGQQEEGNSSGTPYGQYGSRQYEAPYNHIFPAARSGYAPPGLVIPLVLITSLSSHGAKEADSVRASVARNIPMEGNAYIPSGAIVSGKVTEAKGNGFLEHTGSLNIIFDEITLPDGRKFPLAAHLLGGLGDVGYGDVAYSDTHNSLSARQRMENMGISSELGTAGEGGIGLVAAPVYGANFVRGLGSATSIVGAANVLGNMFRRGHNVVVPSGVQFQIQLDTALRIGPDEAQPPAPRSGAKAESGF